MARDEEDTTSIQHDNQGGLTARAGIGMVTGHGMHSSGPRTRSSLGTYCSTAQHCTPGAYNVHMQGGTPHHVVLREAGIFASK
jgi:hypothetical protein